MIVGKEVERICAAVDPSGGITLSKVEIKELKEKIDEFDLYMRIVFFGYGVSAGNETEGFGARFVPGPHAYLFGISKFLTGLGVKGLSK